MFTECSSEFGTPRCVVSWVCGLRSATLRSVVYVPVGSCTRRFGTHRLLLEVQFIVHLCTAVQLLGGMVVSDSSTTLFRGAMAPAPSDGHAAGLRTPAHTLPGPDLTSAPAPDLSAALCMYMCTRLRGRATINVHMCLHHDPQFGRLNPCIWPG